MSKKNRWIGGALLFALIALTMFLLLRNQPVTQLLNVLSGIQPGYVLLGLGLMFLFVGSEAMCSKLILGRLGHRLPYRRCLGFSFIGFYVSSITPSATGGQPAQIYYMSKNGVPAAHGALNMMMIAVCYQVTVLVYAFLAAIFQPGLIADMGAGMGVLLLFGALVMLTLTAGMLCFMFLPNAARRLMGGLLTLGVRLRIVRDRAAAQEKLDVQMEEYRAGAECFKRNAALVPVLLLLNFLQLTALFLVPFVVYKAFGLSGYGMFTLVGAQALLTLATSSLPLPGAVGATEGGFLRVFGLFFGSTLVTPAVLVSRGISFYAFLMLSAAVALAVHFTTKRRNALKKGAVSREIEGGVRKSAA